MTALHACPADGMCNLNTLAMSQCHGKVKQSLRNEGPRPLVLNGKQFSSELTQSQQLDPSLVELYSPRLVGSRTVSLNLPSASQCDPSIQFLDWYNYFTATSYNCIFFFATVVNLSVNICAFRWSSMSPVKKVFHPKGVATHRLRSTALETLPALVILILRTHFGV